MLQSMLQIYVGGSSSSGSVKLNEVIYKKQQLTCFDVENF